MIPVSFGDKVSAAGRPRRAVGSYPVAEGGRSPFEMARQRRFVTGILPFPVDQHTHHFLHHTCSNSTCRIARVVNFSARPTYLHIVHRQNGRSRRLAPTLLTAFQIPTRTS